MTQKDVNRILKRLKTEPVRRTFEISERAAMNEQERTLSVAFASETPVEHWFGKLVLSMDGMRTERLKAGAPLLVEHDPGDQVGVIENFSVSGGVARAAVRFSRSQRGEELYLDVLDGIRRSISVGFLIHDLRLESEKAGELPVYRSDDWTPYEVSVVSIPADISVGVGRSQNPHQKKEGKMEQEKSLIEFGEIFGEAELARRVILANPDATREDVRRAIVAKQDSRPDPAFPVESPGQYISRTGYYEPAHSIPRYGRLQGFKGPDSERRAHRFGQWLLGGAMGNRPALDWCRRNGLLTRAGQQGGLNEKGGLLVPEEFGNDLIDLAEQFGVFRRNAKVVPMSSDTRSDPIVAGELTSEWVGELEQGTDQDLEFGSVRLTAKKHCVFVPVSSEIAEDASVSIADTVAVAAARAFAKREDESGFNGDGTSTYGGMVGIRQKLRSVDPTIANIAGLQVGSGNAYSELTLADFEGVAARLPDFADDGSAKWYVSRSFYYNVMLRLLLSSSPTASEIEQARSNRSFLGYPVEFSQVMPKTEANSQICAILGNLPLGARFGDRRAVTVAIDDSILFRSDSLLIRLTSRFDINVHGAGSTVEPGPIVGLITAGA